MNCQRLYEDEYLETKIMNIVDDNIDYNEVIRLNNHYEFHYFLSYLRHDLFRWYPFKKDGSLLEIGSSYGQLTSLFTQKVNRVVSIEDTKSKCELVSKRSKEADVILSNFYDIGIAEKFDYIVLCDIFEYAKTFFDSKNPYEDYLKYLRKFLKEDGVILIALSNRLGLKYFAGFREEHTNKFFEGIDGYSNTEGVVTFSRNELINIINQSGYSNYKFFYPFPDHHFPSMISTDSTVDKIIHTKQTKYFYDRTYCFDEGKLIQAMAKDNLNKYFTNSFLVEIRNSNSEYNTDNIKFVKLNSDRNEEFRTSTIIWTNDMVSKSPINNKANDHIQLMFENSKLEIGKLKCLPAKMDGNSIYYKFLNEKSYEDLVVDAIIDDDKEEFFNLIENYYNSLFYNSFESNDYANDDFLKIFVKKSDITFHCHDKSNLDVILSNIFILDDDFVVIDYEWIFDFKIPLEYIFYRVINHHFKTNNLINEFTNIEEIFNHFDLDIANINLFNIWENNFLRYVFNHPPFPKSLILPFNVDNLNKFDEYFDLTYNFDDSNPNKIESLKKDIVLNQRNIINLKNKELAEKNYELKKKNNELKKKNKKINSLINSKSWKITKPLRKLKFIFKR